MFAPNGHALASAPLPVLRAAIATTARESERSIIADKVVSS
jgi:hypothetical protein